MSFERKALFAGLRRASGPEVGQNLTDLAEIWTKLAAEIEFDSGLLRTLSELELSEPYDAFPRALAAHIRIGISMRTEAAKAILTNYRI